MRLTNDIRDNIRAKIMSDVPTIDYRAMLFNMVQDIIVEHMDPRVRAVYEDEKLRPLLDTNTCRFRLDNGYNYSVHTCNPDHNSHYGEHAGLPFSLDICLEPRVVERTKKGSIYYDVMHAAMKSGHVHKHFEQQNLLDSVKKRVRSTLSSVGTVSKLYDVLEPEFHHLIPREDDKKIQLPATAAPFAEDLRKLGANLPKVPKAKKTA